MIPSASSPSSSSASERIIPSESTPRSFAAPEPRAPPGITAPGSATGTVWPAATLGAPQTIVRVPSPVSTSQTRQPVGVGVRLDRDAPFRPRSPPPDGGPSVGDPLDLGGPQRQQLAPAPRRPGRDRSTRAARRLGHSHRNCSSTRTSFSKNLRRSGTPCFSIAIRSIPIPNAKPWTARGRSRCRCTKPNTFGSTIPEPRISIQPVPLQIGVARAVRELPSAAAAEAGDVHLDARLGEGEEPGTEARGALGPEERSRELVEGPLEIRERDVLAPPRAPRPDGRSDCGSRRRGRCDSSDRERR